MGLRGAGLEIGLQGMAEVWSATQVICYQIWRRATKRFTHMLSIFLVGIVVIAEARPERFAIGVIPSAHAGEAILAKNVLVGNYNEEIQRPPPVLGVFNAEFVRSSSMRSEVKYLIREDDIPRFLSPFLNRMFHVFNWINWSVSTMQEACDKHASGGSFAIICDRKTDRYWTWSIRKLDIYDVFQSDPRALIQLVLLNRGSERFFGLLLRQVHRARFPIDVSDCTPHLLRGLLAAPSHFIELSLHCGQLGMIDGSLPYSNADSAESGKNQCAREQSKLRIGFDLRSCELMLLILAPAAGCLFFVFRGIKNDSPSLTMVLGYVSLFFIGQLAVYLLCRRIYGI